MELGVGLGPPLKVPLVLSKVLLETGLELGLKVGRELFPGLGGALRAGSQALALDRVLFDVDLEEILSYF